MLVPVCSVTVNVSLVIVTRWPKQLHVRRARGARGKARPRDGVRARVPVVGGDANGQGRAEGFHHGCGRVLDAGDLTLREILPLGLRRGLTRLGACGVRVFYCV